MHSRILPNAWIVLRFPSGQQRMVEVVPNSVISIGKFGSFAANLLLHRPYHYTYELLDKSEANPRTRLRIIPPNELQAEILADTDAPPSESQDEPVAAVPKAAKDDDAAARFDIVADDGTVLIRSNRLTVDDPSRQKLTHEEIEALKRAETGGGKEIIARILENHSALGEKTSFSLQKYTVRKAKKYLRRFTIYPIDVARLCEIVGEQNGYRIMEMRGETLSLLMSWANVRSGGGRWLVIDDAGGLVVAAMAERMGILYPDEEEGDGDEEEAEEEEQADAEDVEMADVSAITTNGDSVHSNTDKPPDEGSDGPQQPSKSSKPHAPRKSKAADHMAATSGSITLLHAAAQPNTSLLKHFNFPPENPPPSHPLYSRLKMLSWLALLAPESDPALNEPPSVPLSELNTWKSGRKSAYWKKRRRWERMKRVVEETRQGGFDGLIIASEGMEIGGILRRLVPLVKGGGQIVAYSATPEPLAEVMDLYSRDRRTAYTKRTNNSIEADSLKQPGADGHVDTIGPSTSLPVTPFGEDGSVDVDDFPVNPTLLLAPMMQTVRARHWQVLPGRTHPIMMAKGGAEGYIFSATRVIPAQGKVEARGRFAKSKKKKDEGGEDIEERKRKLEKEILDGASAKKAKLGDE